MGKNCCCCQSQCDVFYLQIYIVVTEITFAKIYLNIKLPIVSYTITK